jgi:hypothetical protein
MIRMAWISWQFRTRQQPQLSLPGVAVEKLFPANVAKIKLCQDALYFKTFSIPQILAVWDEKRVFQHALAISLKSISSTELELEAISLSRERSCSRICGG